jgi:hypothetical protein
VGGSNDLNYCKGLLKASLIIDISINPEIKFVLFRAHPDKVLAEKYSFLSIPFFLYLKNGKLDIY